MIRIAKIITDDIAIIDFIIRFFMKNIEINSNDNKQMRVPKFCKKIRMFDWVVDKNVLVSSLKKVLLL